MSGLTGVSSQLTAFHTDTMMDEGRHEHTWTVTAWWPAEPHRDARALKAMLIGLLAVWQGVDLPPELWAAEDLAAAIMRLLPACVAADVDRAAEGFHARATA